MSLKRKLLIGAFLLFIALVGFYYLAVSVIYGGSGPSPNIVLVVSSSDYKVENVLATIDGMKADLGIKINKHNEPSPNSYSMYKHAYWYPSNGSNIYGIALVEWNTSSWKNDEAGMGGRYFIDVYSDTKECKLCSLLKITLQQAKVKFSSPCENPIDLTKYEKIRCGI